MNIYDFDGTIYDGDSSVDFIKYCFKKNKRCFLLLPKFLMAFFLYIFKFYSKEEMKAVFFSILKYFDNTEDIVSEFWNKYEYKLKRELTNIKAKEKVVVSASPEFLLKPILDKYKYKLIGSKVDIKTGKFMSLNCYGAEKVRRLNEIGITKCDKFYSDSFSDQPVANISKKAFFVKKSEIYEWYSYKEDNREAIYRKGKKRDILAYLLMLLIMSILSIVCSCFLSLVTYNVIISYILGAFFSICITYIINALINFKVKVSFSELVLFILNNFIAFIFQISLLIILYNLLGFNRIIAYIIASFSVIPIAYILIKNDLCFYTADNSFNKIIDNKFLIFILIFILAFLCALLAVYLMIGNVTMLPIIITFIV